jgi:hypothetical protein
MLMINLILQWMRVYAGVRCFWNLEEFTWCCECVCVCVYLVSQIKSTVFRLCGVVTMFPDCPLTLFLGKTPWVGGSLKYLF